MNDQTLKLAYVEPTLDVVRLQTEDIVRTSGGDNDVTFDEVLGNV